jgi:protein kinase X
MTISCYIDSQSHTLSLFRYCTFQDQHCLYMVMGYVQGGELFRHLRKAGRFGNDTTRFYAAEIILAIEYLHSKDIIYR